MASNFAASVGCPRYGLGIRSSGIAYSEANTLGSGLKEARDGGLTEFGRQAVRRMNKLGIAIDISHSGDQTSLDTIEDSCTSRITIPTDRTRVATSCMGGKRYD